MNIYLWMVLMQWNMWPDVLVEFRSVMYMKHLFSNWTRIIVMDSVFTRNIVLIGIFSYCQWCLSELVLISSFSR
jgi:hypothetical protein